MSEKKTDVATGVAVELDQRDQQTREQITEANATYWFAVQKSADGGKVSSRDAAQVADAMELLGRSREDFAGHVQALRDVRELREQGNSERAEELQHQLKGEAQEVWDRVLEARKQVGDLEAEFNNASARIYTVMDQATARRTEAGLTTAIERLGASDIYAAAALVAGRQPIIVEMNPDVGNAQGSMQRYLGPRYSIDGTYTAGTVTTTFLLDHDDRRNYPASTTT